MKLKRFAAFAASLALLASSLPAAAGAAASEPVRLTYNGTEVPFTDAVPYAEDGTVFIPIRAAAEHLGFAVTHVPAEQAVRLSSEAGDITFRIFGSSAEFDGASVVYEPASVLKSDRVFVPLSFFENVLGLAADYHEEERTADLRTPAQEPAAAETLVSEILQLLLDRDYHTLSDRWFTEELKEEVPVEMLRAVWEEAAPMAGEFTGIAAIRTVPLEDGLLGMEAELAFEKMNFLLSLAMNAQQRLAGIWLQPAAPAAEAPANIIEEEVVVGAGTDYELGGTLALPADALGPLPAVVLVHGSGPSDRDESAAAYKTFRDLAWGLAEQGIAVLRYDKRTFVYGVHSVPEGELLTVKEETVDDAIAAANLLKADERIDASRVYIIGHSLGGMLAPRIDAEGGDFAGLVLLAGSPRALWEIIYDQNMNAIAAMDDDDPAKAQNLAFVEAEYEKALRIAEMTDEEAKFETLFGLPAYYFKEMDAFDWASYAASLEKPVLVLQGEDDFQVFADVDFKLYQEQLKDRPNVTFKLYPGLNHFFVDYSGPGEGTIDEYFYPGQVDPAVISDIAAWIKSQS